VLGEGSTGAVAGDVSRAAPAGPTGAPRFRRALAALRRVLTAPPGSAWRDPVIVAIAVLAFAAYFVISLYRLLQLTPSSYDLGIYTEFVKQLSQLHAPIDDVLGTGFNLEGNHFQIAVGVIAPFFRLFPTPATLLCGQAVFAALSVFPVAAVALLFTGRRSTGRLIAFAYAFSWGLQQMIVDDFHEIAIAVPLLAFALSALVRRRPGAVIGWAVPLVFVKEDQGFTVAALGILLGATAAFPRLLAGPPGPPGPPGPLAAPAAVARPGRLRSRPRWPAWLGGRLLTGGGPWDYGYAALWGGLFLVAWGLFWSTFAITVIIPHFNPLHQYYFWTNGGAVGGGKPFSAGALLVQAGGGWPTKAQTLALLFLPTAFAALGSPVTLVALPSLVLRFISTNQMFWGTAWHYNATVMPILFIAAAEAIGRWRRVPALAWPVSPAGPRPAGGLRGLVHAAQVGIVRHGGAMMAAITVALAFQFPLSGLWHSSTYQLSDHVAAADAAMAVVPDGATVTTTLDLLAPLAARTDTFWIGNAGNPVTQYIVFDGANSGYSPAVTDVPGFIARWYQGDGYKQVFASADVYVFRRG
jgi:uncharacterized membrane protein